MFANDLPWPVDFQKMVYPEWMQKNAAVLAEAKTQQS
jgi:hypothetical protein